MASWQRSGATDGWPAGAVLDLHEELSHPRDLDTAPAAPAKLSDAQLGPPSTRRPVARRTPCPLRTSATAAQRRRGPRASAASAPQRRRLTRELAQRQRITPGCGPQGRRTTLRASHLARWRSIRRSRAMSASLGARAAQRGCQQLTAPAADAGHVPTLIGATVTDAAALQRSHAAQRCRFLSSGGGGILGPCPVPGDGSPGFTHEDSNEAEHATSRGSTTRLPGGPRCRAATVVLVPP